MKTNIVLKVAVAILALLIIAVVAWTAWSNKALEITTYTISSDKISVGSQPYRIAQISDLHNSEFGKDNERLINALQKAHPDIIVFTGDLIDSRRTDVESAVEFVSHSVKIAPCYYINGNHESRVTDEYLTLKSELESLGVVILENTAVTISDDIKNIESLVVMGINDPDFYTQDSLTITDENIKGIMPDDSYTILLTHRPELFNVYVENEIDLALTGHAHGGQFRLPFIGGLFAPHQGFFPEYDSGLYTKNDTNMIVSRGIGNSIFPFRFNNRPEIVVVELTSGNNHS